jgi:hypothetical protein
MNMGEYYNSGDYLYFISDYKGVTYHIKDQDFLNKTWKNIIYCN